MNPCNGCGNCCSYGGKGRLGTVPLSTIQLWSKEKPEILNYVYNENEQYHIWFHHQSKKIPKQCPWLIKGQGKYTFQCAIHDIKPSVCHNYPLSIMQMLRDKCEMLDPKDHLNMTLEELEDEMKRLKNR